MNKVGSRRISAAEAFLTPEVRARDNFTLRADTLMRRVLFRNRRVSGVELEGKECIETVVTERVVLCAGAIDTPGILLRSGVGPRAAQRLPRIRGRGDRSAALGDRWELLGDSGSRPGAGHRDRMAQLFVHADLLAGALANGQKNRHKERIYAGNRETLRNSLFWLTVNQTRPLKPSAVPTPRFALEVHRVGPPGQPGAYEGRSLVITGQSLDCRARVWTRSPMGVRSRSAHS
jgi:choline dehydrogenase-like flavoprotein